MPSSYTSVLRLELQATGENQGTWGTNANTVFQLLEDSLTGIAAISTTGGTDVLTTNNSSTDEARMAVISITGALGSPAIIEIPNESKRYLVLNETTNAFDVSIKTNGGSAVVIPRGILKEYWCDGVDVITEINVAFESGTKQLFVQTAAPIGWTKDTTHDNKALRLVTGAASTGGSSPFTTVFGLTAVEGTALTEAQLASHDHPMAHTHTIAHTHTVTAYSTSGANITDASGGPVMKQNSITSSGSSTPNSGGSSAGNTSNAGSGATHAHDIDLQVEYVDTIIATAD